MVRFNANRNIGLIRPGDGRGAQLGWPNRLQHWHNHPSVNGFALILGIELGEGMFLGYDYWSGCYGYSSNGWSGYNPPGVWIAPDYVVTPWFFDTATGRWYRPGYGYFYNAPSGYYGPVTVTVPEDVWVSEYQDDQGNDVPGHYEIELIVYTAFYVEDWGRWGYRHHDFRRNTDVFVWLNL
jgi:hypothetical protein